MQMNKIIAFAAAGLTMLGAASAANAQASASGTANGSVTLMNPITITKTADISFGRIIKPTSGTGSVAIPFTNDTVTAGSGATAMSGITTSRAKFTIAGEGGQAVSVSVPATFDLTKGGDTITVTLDDDLGTSTTLSNTVGTPGSASLNIGGSFSLPSGQASGAYTGSFAVTVAYQ